MKAVYRVKEWRFNTDGSRLVVRCSRFVGGTKLCRVLCACFPDLTATVAGSEQARGFLAGLSAEVEIEFSGIVPPREELSNAMNLLTNVLTVCDDADASHCLDLYKLPDDRLPSDEWPYTPVGRLVYRAKYRWNQSCARDVAKEMALFVASHPAFRAAGAIGAMPSSGSGQWYDAPPLWRQLLARQFGFQEIHIWRTRPVAAQKAITDKAEKARNQQNSMDCDAAVAGRSVIVLDDLYMDGDTLAEAVPAARARGARQVLALCAVKTATGTQGGVADLVDSDEVGGDVIW